MAQTIQCPMCTEEIEADVKICPHCQENFVGVWRDEKTLVMRSDAVLPDRCIKTNLPAETKLKRTLTWHPGWVYCLLPLGLLFYVIAAAVIQQTAKIEIGLTHEWARKRRKVILVAWLLVLGGLGVIIGGFATLEGDAPAITFIVGILMCLGGIIYGMLSSRMITVVKIVDDHVSFNGVCDEYLAELPDWDDWDAD